LKLRSNHSNKFLFFYKAVRSFWQHVWRYSDDKKLSDNSKTRVMKLKFLILIGGVAAIASCGPSYRATNQSTVNSDTTGQPSSSIQSSFSTQYPNAGNVAWSAYDPNATTSDIDWDLNGWPALSQGDYVATFNQNNDKYYAWYDANGNWIGSTYSVSDYKSLPAPINTTLNDKFPGYTIESVNREMQKDKTAYEIKLKNGDSKAKVLVDDTGTIIKQKTVTK
jgi:uncharacterized membrane protein YkoI